MNVSKEKGLLVPKSKSLIFHSFFLPFFLLNISYFTARGPIIIYLFLFRFRVLLSNDNVSDSSDSHAYYSKVPKEELLQSLEPQRPPPLKEHLYQNFDQVFLEQHRHHHQQAHHPDLLNMSSKGINDGFYENTRSRSNHPEEEVVIVNDEK